MLLVTQRPLALPSCVLGTMPHTVAPPPFWHTLYGTTPKDNLLGQMAQAEMTLGLSQVLFVPLLFQDEETHGPDPRDQAAVLPRYGQPHPRILCQRLLQVGPGQLGTSRMVRWPSVLSWEQ